MLKGLRHNNKPNNKTQNSGYRMPPGIWYKGNITINPNSQCLTTFDVKAQSPNRNGKSYRQSNNMRRLAEEERGQIRSSCFT
ncbi:hypothetical protein L873DRAFT_1816513 [Choiromyces venosus 120613-1]|uniref:Uncharacterized protein n=1 Tax=Choiromyces venosus 120613-1 TaxID=1336337 RepID=A0A3N4J4P6_9PEZI|nr:hypothetical protein L873DRAFT_1816513 [Choiromyces venosus 120613-1]